MNTTRTRHRVLGLALFGLGLLGLSGEKVWALNVPANATITVTPVANVALSISPTTYAFGNLVVNTSSITASPLTLSNTGQVNVTVSKQITNQSNPAGWTAATAVSTDTYVLSVTTAAVQAVAADFTSPTQLTTGITNLTGAAGTQPILTLPGGALPSVALYFKLDMPSVITSQVGREITVQFTGTAQ